MKVGRPTDYDPDYCEQVLAWGKLGKSRAWMAAELSVCKQTLVNWENAHPAFLAALSRASVLSQQWWEDAGQVGMVSDKFNNEVWTKSMSCRFPDDWRDKTAIVGGDDSDKPVKTETKHLGLDEFARRIASIAARTPPRSGDVAADDGAA